MAKSPILTPWFRLIIWHVEGNALYWHGCSSAPWAPCHAIPRQIMTMGYQVPRSVCQPLGRAVELPAGPPTPHGAHPCRCTPRGSMVGRIRRQPALSSPSAGSASASWSPEHHRASSDQLELSVRGVMREPPSLVVARRSIYIHVARSVSL